MATTQRSATTQNDDHIPGTMDVTAHQRTFDGFVRIAAWNVVAIAAVLIFLALANS